MIDQPSVRIQMFQLTAASKVPTPKMTMPIVNIRLIPRTSPSLAPVMMSAAITSE